MKTTLALATLFAAAAVAGPALAATPDEIMSKEKCSKCHTATTTKKGPSFADVAAKYKGKPDAVAQLVEVLKTGGKDDHPTVKASDDELKAVVTTVLAK